MSSPYELVIGTTNLAKGRELRELLAPRGFVVKTLQDFPSVGDVEEDGETFAENARKKAREYAQRLNAWVLTDDSGLEVEALGGGPGIYSARYAGDGAMDEDNNRKLLAELAAVPRERRRARYFCHVALADPRGLVRAESSGVCTGRIAESPAGKNGFGYDPLFEVLEYHQTFGQLGPQVKSALSHRARAMRAIVPKILGLVRNGEWT